MTARTRVPVLIGLFALVEFQLELALLVAGDTPRRALAAVLLVVMAGAVPLAALPTAEYDGLVLPFFAAVLGAFWLGRRCGRVVVLVGLVVCVPLALWEVALHRDATRTGALFTVAILLGAPVLVGRMLRSRAELNRALREKAELLERRRAGAAGRAVADERARIAGELHDVVAHALSAMTVQATGARRLALTRPALAREAFVAIETAGREALDELRRLLGVLRRDDAELTLAPQPSLCHVHSLLRRAAVPATLSLEGEPRELAPGLDVTAFRVVQDALTAAEEHDAHHAHVRLRFTPTALVISVRDDGPSPEPRPLIGTRERVLLHGGRLTAGASRGGYHVRATLPLDASGEPQAGHERLVAPARLSAAAHPSRGRLAGAWRWLRRRDVADVLAVAVLAVVAVTEVAAAGERSGPLVANVAVALAYTVPFAWRRRAPLASLAASVGAIIVMGLFLTPVDDLFVPFLVTLATIYAGAAHRDGREAWATLVLGVVALPLIIGTMGEQSLGDFVFPTLIAAGAWLAGRVVRARTRLAERLHEAAAQLAEASAVERRLAAVDERRRIARELHDLVAHSISVMVVQAGGARRILDKDPARALDAATRIERTGREALGEMRHLLGMLGAPDDAPALAPQPTLGEVGELVTRARAAGLPATLVVHGERRGLPAGLELAAYRIVQEAITNAIKHAPGAATTVTVAWDEHQLALEVRDAGRGSSPNGHGHGLVGMRERVRLYGGELDAGPSEEGGWRVRARLPLEVRELTLT